MIKLTDIVDEKKDITTVRYWSCRSHRMRSLGNKGKGKYW